MAVLVY